MDFEIQNARRVSRFLVGGRYEAHLWLQPAVFPGDSDEFIVVALALDLDKSVVQLLSFDKYATSEMGKSKFEEASKKCQKAADKEFASYDDVARWTSR